MGRTFVRQDEQVRRSETYDDDIAAGQAALETASTCLQDDLNAARSQLRRWMYADGGNNYYDDVPTVTTLGSAKKRGIYDLAVHVDALEEHRILFRAQVLTDVSVPAAAKATGTITTDTKANFTDGELFTLNDGLHSATIFEIDTDGGGVTPGNVQVDISGDVSADDVRDTIIAAVNGVGATLNITASNGGAATVNLQNDVNGTCGNHLITSTVLAPAWATSGMSGGTGDIVVLSVAGTEAPSETAAVGAVTTNGAVVAYNSDFPTWKLATVAGPTGIRPKNLCVIRDATTKEIITSGGMDVYALLCSESSTNPHTFDDAGNQVELVFVREDAAGTALEHVPGEDIAGKTINYSYVRRLDFDNLPETAFLSEVFLDQAGTVDVTRQNAYDNQSTTPVDLTTDAILDIEVAGKKWEIRDTLEASLFKITEGAGGGTTELAIGSDVDTFNVDAQVNDFAKPVTVDSTGVDLQLGVTAIANTATIDTLAGKDLRLDGRRELYLDDGWQDASTWVQTSGITLSDATAEWDNFKTAFGEVSLLNAIVQAQGSAARAKEHANVITADINANVLIDGSPGAPNISAQLPSYKGLDFEDDVDVYINGLLQRPGSGAGSNNDVYPSAVAGEQALGNFYCEYKLLWRGGLNPDVIIMIVYGTPTP